MSTNPSANPTSQVSKRRPDSPFVAGMLLLVFVFVVGLGVFEVVSRNIPPDAVRIRQSEHASGRILAQRLITDPRTVADDYAQVNSLPQASPVCYPISRPTNPSDYTVIFLRWGIPIEDATQSQAGCLAWSINRGGIPDRLPHNDPSNAMEPILAQLQP